MAERRTDAVARARAALEGVVSAAGGRLLARAENDACYEGQQNWKRDDGYAHRCTVRQVVVVGFASDFRRRIALLDRRLFASGWAMCSTCDQRDTLSGFVEEYWDLRVRSATAEHPFSISRLPTPGIPYVRGDLQLTFDFAGRDRIGRSVLESVHRMPRASLFRSYERPRRLDVDAVIAGAKPDEHVLVAAIEVDYFES